MPQTFGRNNTSLSLIRVALHIGGNDLRNNAEEKLHSEDHCEQLQEIRYFVVFIHFCTVTRVWHHEVCLTPDVP